MSDVNGMVLSMTSWFSAISVEIYIYKKIKNMIHELLKLLMFLKLVTSNLYIMIIFEQFF